MSLVFINYPLETFTPTSSGALATIVYECCREAEKAGIVPWMITNTNEAPMYQRERLLPISYCELPASPIALTLSRAERKVSQWRHLRYRSYVAQVFRQIKQNRLAELPMVVLNDPEMVVLLRRRFPSATILHWFFNHMEAKPRFRAAFGSAATHQAAVSDFTGRFVAGHYGLKADAVRTIYIAADTEHFRPSDAPPEGKPVLNFVGRTGREKAPDTFLQAALMLSGHTREFGVQMLGSNHWGRLELDDYQRELAGYASELEARGVSVARPGFISRPDLPGWLQRAAIHVVPSRWDEPFALATMEGMSTGLATVASRTGGTPEAVEGHGFLFERDDVDALAALLRPLVLDRALRTEYGARARKRALEFTWRRTWSTLAETIGL